MLRVGYDGCLVKRANFGVGKCILQLAEALAQKRLAVTIDAPDVAHWVAP